MGDSGKMGEMAESFETIRYETDGAVATITMNRPDMANAQNSTLIDELDAAFDLADADDAVRVVILAGAGKHFSSGHDLKALVSGDGSDPWVALRETPEGKFQHEKTMYYDRCLRIHDFRKPTIAAVQGSCVAAGLMLAAMCDLIVAADDAVLLQPGPAPDRGRRRAPGGALGARASARRRSSCSPATPSTPRRRGAWAWSTGSSPGPNSRRGRGSWPTGWPCVPPVTAQTVKDTINQTGTLMGKRDALKYHFMAHHWVHNSATALDALAARKAKGSMRDVMAERDQGHPEPRA